MLPMDLQYYLNLRSDHIHNGQAGNSFVTAYELGPFLLR